MYIKIIRIIYLHLFYTDFRVCMYFDVRFFRKYKWLFLAITSVIKLNTFLLRFVHTFNELTHIIHFTAVEVSIFKNARKKIDLNWTQPNLHATTENFLFSTSNPYFNLETKSNFCFENKIEKRGASAPPPDHYKIIFCPLTKVLVCVVPLVT